MDFPLLLLTKVSLVSPMRSCRGACRASSRTWPALCRVPVYGAGFPIEAMKRKRRGQRYKGIEDIPFIAGGVDFNNNNVMCRGDY